MFQTYSDLKAKWKSQEYFIKNYEMEKAVKNAKYSDATI